LILTNKAASPQPLHKIIVYFELMQSGKKKHSALLRPCAFPLLAENFARAFNSFYFIGTKFPIKQEKPIDKNIANGLDFVISSMIRSIFSKDPLSLCRDELRHRNPIRKPLFMRVCELSVLILPTVCPQDFFAHRLSLHLFFGLIIAYFVE